MTSSKYPLSTATTSENATRPSLRRDSRGSAAKEYLVATLLIGLMGLGGFQAFGRSASEAIGGEATSSAAPLAAPMAVAMQAGEETSGAAPVDPLNPFGVLGLTSDELQGRVGAIETELDATYTDVINNGYDQMTDEQYYASEDAQRADAYLQTLDQLLSETNNELHHVGFENQYNPDGTLKPAQVFNALAQDYADSTAKLEAWVAEHGNCFNEDGTPTAACGNDIQFLANVNAAQAQDLDRRMFELGYQLNSETGAPEPVPGVDPNSLYWQGSWTPDGIILGEDGAPLADEQGRTYIYEPGTSPLLAVSGEVAPIGYYDAEGNRVPLDGGPAVDDKGKNGGPFSFILNGNIGVLKEGWDMLSGAVVAVKRVGFDFLGQDLLGGTLGGVCKAISFGNLCKGSETNPLKVLKNTWNNVSESVVTFGKGVWPAIKTFGNTFWHEGITCLNLANHHKADSRGQACGRTVLSVGTLLIPASKAATAGKAALAARGIGGGGKVAAEATAATVGDVAGAAGKAGRIASILERMPGGNALIKGGEALSKGRAAIGKTSEFLATSESKVATMYRGLQEFRAARAAKKVTKATERSAANRAARAAKAMREGDEALVAERATLRQVADDMEAAGGVSEHVAKRLAQIDEQLSPSFRKFEQYEATMTAAEDAVRATKPGQGTIRERLAAHKARQVLVRETLGEKATFGTAVKSGFIANRGGFWAGALGSPIRLPLKLLKHFAWDSPKYRVASMQLRGMPWTRVARFLWNNRDVTAPTGAFGGGFNHAEHITEDMDAKMGYPAN